MVVQLINLTFLIGISLVLVIYTGFTLSFIRRRTVSNVQTKFKKPLRTKKWPPSLVTTVLENADLNDLESTEWVELWNTGKISKSK